MKKKIILFLAAIISLFSVVPTYAQPAGKIPRIGFLDNSTASGMAVLIDAFRQEMSKLGRMDRGKEYHHRVPVCRAKE